jgi:hypothetical protein
VWTYTASPPYVFIAWCFVKYRICSWRGTWLSAGTNLLILNLPHDELIPVCANRQLDCHISWSVQQQSSSHVVTISQLRLPFHFNKERLPLSRLVTRITIKILNRRFERYLGKTARKHKTTDKKEWRWHYIPEILITIQFRILHSCLLPKEVNIRIYKNYNLASCVVWVRIFGPRRQEAQGGWRKFHDEMFHCVRSS